MVALPPPDASPLRRPETLLATAIVLLLLLAGLRVATFGEATDVSLAGGGEHSAGTSVAEGLAGDADDADGSAGTGSAADGDSQDSSAGAATGSGSTADGGDHSGSTTGGGDQSGSTADGSGEGGEGGSASGEGGSEGGGATGGTTASGAESGGVAGGGDQTTAAAPAAGEVVAGTCFDATGGPQTATVVTTFGCEQEHDNEIYVVARAEDPAYPGRESLQDRSGALCRGDAFTTYVGVPWADSRFFTAAFFPDEETWAAGDRTIVCALYDIRGPKIGSARGTGQ